MNKLNEWFKENVFSIDFLRLLIGASTIAFITCIVCVYVCAYSADYFPRQVTFSNPSNVPIESVNINLVSGGTWHSETQLGSYTIDTTIGSSLQKLTVTVSSTGVDFGALGAMTQFENQNFPYGTYEVLFYSLIEAPSLTTFTPLYEPPGFIQGLLDDELPCVVILDDGTIGTDFYLAQDSSVESMACMTIVLIPLDEEPPVDECPSLQVQINQFNGTYSDFEGLLLGSSNEVIYQGYRNKLQEMFRQGQDSVTLEQLLAEYDGSFQQLITLLSENNLRLLDEYAYYIEEQRTLSYNDGYAQGNEDGYNDGYNSGYNKGSSEVFGETLLGDTFNMPLNALNNWVLFETTTGLEVTMGGLFTAVIALAVLIIFLKMFAGG